MRQAMLMVGIMAGVSWTPACNKKSAFPPTDEGAKALLQQFLAADADHVKLSLALKPQRGDYARVFADAAMAKKAETVYADLWSGVAKRPFAPRAGQTAILLWSATTDELKAGTGDSKEFPGGYKRAVLHLKKGLKVYRFKFVKPGETLGMAFDGLYTIDGRWVLMPKPWRITG